MGKLYHLFRWNAVLFAHLFTQCEIIAAVATVPAVVIAMVGWLDPYVYRSNNSTIGNGLEMISKTKKLEGAVVCCHGVKPLFCQGR